jgi:esterase/lipase superfamily enzyme
MELLVFGHAGARVLVFPTSMGRFFEWEDRGMIGMVADQIDRGWLQLFCVDSVDAESWYAKHKHPNERARRHAQYDAYLEHELLPFTRSRNGNPFFIATGASFGAYHAVAFAFRHPHLVNRVLAMSGLYDMREMTEGYSDTDVYYANPSDFIQHETDHDRLEAIRRIDTILAIGRGDPAYWNNEQLSKSLWNKGIPHAFRAWDGWAHDWPWWQQMFRRYVAGHD